MFSSLVLRLAEDIRRMLAKGHYEKESFVP